MKAIRQMLRMMIAGVCICLLAMPVSAQWQTMLDGAAFSTGHDKPIVLSSMAVFNNRLYLADINSGNLYYTSTESPLVQKVQSEMHTPLRKIVVCDSKLYTLHQDEVGVLNGDKIESLHFYLEEQRVNDLAQVNGKLILACSGGLFQFNPAKFSLKKLVPDAGINALANSGNMIYYQSATGFYKMRYGNNLPVRIDNFAYDGPINQLAMANPTLLLAAAPGYGVFELNSAENSWQQVNGSLLDDEIHQVACSDSMIFAISGFNGIYFKQWDDDYWTLCNYGLANRGFNAICASEKEIYVSDKLGNVYRRPIGEMKPSISLVPDKDYLMVDNDTLGFDTEVKGIFSENNYFKVKALLVRANDSALIEVKQLTGVQSRHNFITSTEIPKGTRRFIIRMESTQPHCVYEFTLPIELKGESVVNNPETQH